MLIGHKIRDLRKARNMSLTDLSIKSGVQLATLSRIEHRKMVGTLESHMAIAKALGIEVTQLYDALIKEEAQLNRVENPKSHTDVFSHSDKSSYEILTKNLLSKKMMPILLHIAEGGRTQSEQKSHGAEMFIYVLEGKIDAFVKEDIYKLQKQSTLYFDATLPHYFANTAKETAKILAVLTPVYL